nr:hypothetical protein Iba_scaffold13493CG0010 [Ipomoea batatas]
MVCSLLIGRRFSRCLTGCTLPLVEENEEEDAGRMVIAASLGLPNGLDIVDAHVVVTQTMVFSLLASRKSARCSTGCTLPLAEEDAEDDTSRMVVDMQPLLGVFLDAECIVS